MGETEGGGVPKQYTKADRAQRIFNGFTEGPKRPTSLQADYPEMTGVAKVGVELDLFLKGGSLVGSVPDITQVPGATTKFEK